MWYPMPILPLNRCQHRFPIPSLPSVLYRNQLKTADTTKDFTRFGTQCQSYHRIGLASAALGHRMSQAYKMFFLYKWFHWRLYCQQRINAYIILEVIVYNKGTKVIPNYNILQLCCTNASSKTGCSSRSVLTFTIVLYCHGRPATFLQASKI